MLVVLKMSQHWHNRSRLNAAASFRRSACSFGTEVAASRQAPRHRACSLQLGQLQAPFKVEPEQDEFLRQGCWTAVR